MTKTKTTTKVKNTKSNVAKTKKADNSAKKAYFATLRENWKSLKEQATKDKDGKKLYLALQKASPNSKVSYNSFYYILHQMKAQGLEGLPYIDCKTFSGWEDNGYIVKKGEHSTVRGITWIERENAKTGESFVFPKEYRLFHRSQVEELDA